VRMASPLASDRNLSPAPWKITGRPHHITANLGSLLDHAGPCILLSSGHKIRHLWTLTCLHPCVPASFHYFSLIPHHMPATQSLDLPPVYIGSLSNIPLHFFTRFFPRPAINPLSGPS
jgi:hypothetical protein